MAPDTFEDSPAGGGTTPRVCLIYEEHKERKHESDNEVEVINADLIGNNEEVSAYGGDPEDAEATILEVRPDQANRQTADLQAPMTDMVAMLTTSVKTIAQSLDLKQAKQFFEMQRFQTSESDKLKEIQKATPLTMDRLKVVVKLKARKKVKGLAPKFFTVAVGRQPGIYTTWAELKAQVDLYPHSQVLTFNLEAAAVQYLSVMAERHSSSDEGASEAAVPAFTAAVRDTSVGTENEVFGMLLNIERNVLTELCQAAIS